MRKKEQSDLIYSNELRTQLIKAVRYFNSGSKHYHIQFNKKNIVFYDNEKNERLGTFLHKEFLDSDGKFSVDNSKKIILSLEKKKVKHNKS